MCQEYTIICNVYPACFRLSYEHNVSFNVGAYMFLFLTFLHICYPMKMIVP